MAAVIAVFLLGVGIGALGLLVPDLYVAGLVVLVIGGVGGLVRLGERISSTGRRRSPPSFRDRDDTVGHTL